MYSHVVDPITRRPTDTCIRRVADAAIVPADPHNTDWQAYQAWLKAGNTPAEPTPPKTPTEA